MPLILTSRVPWRRRPSGLVELDRSSPQAVALLGCWPVTAGDGGLIRDLVAAQHATPSLASVLAIEPTTIGGCAARWTDISASRYATTASSATLRDAPTTYNATFAFWATASAFAGSSVAGGWFGTDDLLIYPYDNTSGNGPGVFWRDVGGFTININSGIPSTGDWHHFAFVTRASNAHDLYVDGALVATSTATGSAGPFSGFDLMGWSDGNQPFQGSACEFRVYGRALTGQEVWALYAPDTRWSLYQPLVVRRYFDLGGAGGPSDLVCDAGAYTLTGYDANLTRARLLTCDAGSYSLTGQDASLTRARLLTADAGSYSVTGRDATLTAARTLTADAGSYTLTGRDATLTKGVQLVADAGSYTVTGFDAGLTWARQLTADAGSYAYTGQDATLQKSAAGDLVADAGAYTLTGYDATLTWARVLTTDTGSYTLTGHDATLTAGQALVCDAGSYTVTGYDATFIYAHVLSADAGSYAYTGHTAILNYSGAVIEVADDAHTWQLARRDGVWQVPRRDTTWRM